MNGRKLIILEKNANMLQKREGKNVFCVLIFITTPNPPNLFRHADSWSVNLVAAFVVIWIPIANTCNAEFRWCICLIAII